MLPHRGRGGDVLRLAIPSTLLLLLFVRPTYAHTWHVPADAPTVQAGIDAAQAGDDVLLAPGTYTRTSENATGESVIDMKPGIWLHSESGAGATILDAEQVGRVMRCADVGDQVVIEGLTLQNSGDFTGPELLAGGIYASGDSDPTIRGCVFQNLTSTQNRNFIGGEGEGGAIVCDMATIEDCWFSNNRTQGLNGRGGAVSCGAVTFLRCTFTANSTGGETGTGGAVVSQGARFTRCRFENNGVSASMGGFGGAIVDGSASIESCTFIHNGVDGDGDFGLSGGAVELGTGSTVHACTFVGNNVSASSLPNGYGEGGAISGGSILIGSSVFVGNTVSGGGRSSGGALSGSGLLVENCTLLANANGATRAAISMQGGTIRASIVAYHDGPVCSGSTGVTWSCCDLFGNSQGNSICGTDGGDNFSLDPQFCSPDPVPLIVLLQSDSPCAPGNHPGGAACGLIGAGAVGCITDADQTPPVAYRLSAPVPNPFNPSTFIHYELPEAAKVRLTIYDVTGRPVKRLLEQSQHAGQHEAIWNGTDAFGRRVASGVYFVELVAGQYRDVERAVLLK